MRCYKAFSLVELMISIALCALVITLLMVNVSFLNRGIVRSEMEKLYSACMYVQQCALTCGSNCVLEFDIEKNLYHFDGRTEKLLSPVIFGSCDNVKGPPSTPSKKISSPITFNGGRIIFHPDGLISSGTVYLTDNNKKILYALSNGIAQISHLRKYSYNGTWRLLP